MAACPLCRSRKGKRSCPALRAAICSVCCGEKRLVEIACPSDCVYLEQGARNDMSREAADYLRHQEPRKALRWIRTVEGLGFLLETIERSIASSSIRSLQDADLLVALTSAKKTFESESKGVLYEDLPTAPSLQVLTRSIVDAVRAFAKEYAQAREKAGPQGAAMLPEWGAAEAAHCLEVLAERCDFHIQRSGSAGAGADERDDPGSYVAYLRRVFPPGAPGTASDGPRIVLA
jgi:hypothetical protein